MIKDNGGPAFPETKMDPWNKPIVSGGMTLRDYFAEAALPLAATRHTQTYIDNQGHSTEYLPETAYEQTAHDAYALADAMLAERAK